MSQLMEQQKRMTIVNKQAFVTMSLDLEKLKQEKQSEDEIFAKQRQLEEFK